MTPNISLPLAVVGLWAKTKRLADKKILMPKVLKMLGTFKMGDVTFVGI